MGVESLTMKLFPIRLVLDAGHGGEDGGAVSLTGVPESQINLAITLRMEEILALCGIPTQPLRRQDISLYSKGARSLREKKVSDLHNRVEEIQREENTVLVSIHQNSFPQESIHGAQVFYHNSSSEGKLLAELIQKELVSKVDRENKRQAKGNTNYYLLKKTKVPLVIVECGFLSNSREAELLCEEDYQDRVAYAICMGILKYLSLGE